MAKDDYFVIVYRVLVYLYGCLKRKNIYEDTTFQEQVRKNVESDEYFVDVLRMMQEDGLIDGLVFKKVWGGDVMLLNRFQDAKITSHGVLYLQENKKMKKVRETLKESADTIAKLAGILLPFV